MMRNRRTYILSDQDYLEIYPLLTPDEIEEEFAGRTKSARTIQRLYRKFGLPSTRESYKRIIDSSYQIADLEIDQDTWLEHVVAEIEIERQNIKKKIWGRIKRVEDFYNNGYHIS